MKTYCTFLLVFILGAALISCDCKRKDAVTNKMNEAPSFDRQWAQKFIDSMNLKFSAEFKKGDSVALASHYWPDAELLLSNMETVKGPGMLQAWGSITRMGIKEFTFSTTDITGNAELLVETGNYLMKDDKAEIADKGKYVVVWQKRNGEWKLFRDIGNSSLPPAK